MGHLNKNWRNIIKEEESGTNKNEVKNTKKGSYFNMTNHKEKGCYNKKKSKEEASKITEEVIYDELFIKK